MGIYYKWADDKPMIMEIYVEFPWTLAEYSKIIPEVTQILRDFNDPCATVVNITKMQALPKDGSILQVMLGVEKSMPDNLFASVIVGTSFAIQTFMNILMKVRPRAKQTALFTATMEEAYTKIEERYAELYPDKL